MKYSIQPGDIEASFKNTWSRRIIPLNSLLLIKKGEWLHARRSCGQVTVKSAQLMGFMEEVWNMERIRKKTFARKSSRESKMILEPV